MDTILAKGEGWISASFLSGFVYILVFIFYFHALVLATGR